MIVYHSHTQFHFQLNYWKWGVNYCMCFVKSSFSFICTFFFQVTWRTPTVKVVGFFDYHRNCATDMVCGVLLLLLSWETPFPRNLFINSMQFSKVILYPIKNYFFFIFNQPHQSSPQVWLRNNACLALRPSLACIPLRT